MEPYYAPTFPAHSVILAVRSAGLEAGLAQLGKRAEWQESLTKPHPGASTWCGVGQSVKEELTGPETLASS